MVAPTALTFTTADWSTPQTVTVTGPALGSANDLSSNDPRLRLIVRAGSGLDNIDLECAQQRGVRVVRVADPDKEVRVDPGAGEVRRPGLAPSGFSADRPYSIAVLANGKALLTTTFDGSGFGATMYQIDLATDAVTPKNSGPMSWRAGKRRVRPLLSSPPMALATADSRPNRTAVMPRG